MADSLDQALSKIRPHTSSSLAHQKAPATLLHAIESTFSEQGTEKTSTAYFAALLTTLDGTLQSAKTPGPSFGDGDILPAELYLLALVSPYVPHPVIRSNLNTVLSLTAPLFSALTSHAPPLRSQLTIYGALFNALDRSELDAQGLRQCFAAILQFCLDPRPKVRKKATEVVKEVLASPPPPSLCHPYAERAAEWVMGSFSDINAGGVPKFKGKKTETDGTDSAIHLLAFLRTVLPNLPPSSLPPITTSLLLLPRLANPYLAHSAYSILAELLTLSVDDPIASVSDQLPAILTAVLSSPPANNDAAFASAWASVLGNAVLAYHAVDAEACVSEMSRVWKPLWALLESMDVTTRKAAVHALDCLTRCFTPALIAAALADGTAEKKKKAVLLRIIAQTQKDLDALAFAQAIPDVLAVISSLILGLRYRGGSRTAPTAAESLLMPLIVRVSELRVQKGFEHKEAADAVLNTAMRVLGPEVLLRELPLNLETTDRQSGREPRAFLLPSLPQPHPSPLKHFVSYFVPLTERMFDLQQKAETEGRPSEAKVWHVLVEQIWAGLPGYCWGTIDLKEALTPEFSQLLSQLLYGQPELRPAILKALKVIVESNVALASEDLDLIAKLPELVRAEAISSDTAAANITFLRALVESWLAVLFNVFSSVGRDGQGMVGDVIGAWIGIANAEDIAKAYRKLVDLLKQNLSKPQAPQFGTAAQNGAGNVTAITQDLLVLVLPYLSVADANALFELCLSADIVESRDNGVQKRGYKILAKLLEGGKITVEAETILPRLEKLVDGLAPAAKKDRFHLLTMLVYKIPRERLHLLPSVIPEAVLGTKEPSEKARDAAFELVVAMGKKMAEGGVVKRDMVDGMDQDDAGDATANVEEYMTMVAGGLAGASPHMISATVTAISRLVFEFRDSLSAQMHTEIFTTLLVFVSSANREIVKSVLGFVKLAIHTMPVELMRPHLPQLVPALLRWSHDHKNHFKAKVRHIFERMLRRFGWNDVYACAGEEEARKVLVNIKKRKDRAKRKKANNAENDEDDKEPSKKPVAGDAFEDVLYGSESELEDSDDETPAAKNDHSMKRKGQTSGTRLRVDDDEPMDLLQGAAAQVTGARNVRKRKPGQDAARFKTDDETGKMVIDNDADSDVDVAGEDVEGGAYRESMTSADGFTRGANGRVKFNKDTKKRRREYDEDVEMGDAEAQGGRKAKRVSEVKFGHEFKAKKAGGDVKKGGVDPYAYLSLSQAAKKNGRKSHIGIAGKR